MERGVVKAGEKVNIVVPTGNFGNILVSYYAGQMGIPVNKFICTSNKNKVLTDFLDTGVYDINRDFYLTNSPSMDISISSNLERLLYHLSGNNGGKIKTLMDKFDAEKYYEVSSQMKKELEAFYGGFATVKDTNATIGKMYRENGYLIDTHTTVAYKVYEDYIKKT